MSLLFLILSLYFFHFSLARSQDSSVLLSFKSSSDPLGLLASWNSSTDPCSGSWIGISSCNSNGRVIRLVLENLSLNNSLQSLSLLPYLSVLSLKNNSLSDPLQLLNLSLWKPHLKHLYLSQNCFSGPIPQSILLLHHLRRLDLSGNLFSGAIPPDIGFHLPNIFTLRIEQNNITGEIPSSIGKIRGLVDLNVSYNNLVGEIPIEVSAFPVSSFIGNTGICGKQFPGRVCPEKNTVKKKKKKSCIGRWVKIEFLIGIAIAGVGLLVVSFVGFGKLMDRKKSQNKESGGSRNSDAMMKGKDEKLVFFEGCREFGMEDLMRGSAEMLWGCEMESTYRVMMEGGSGEVVVVKRMNKERLKRQRKEVEGMLIEIGGWRHPNVLSLLAYYFSEQELLLVFEFKSSRTLQCLLHGK